MQYLFVGLCVFCVCSLSFSLSLSLALSRALSPLPLTHFFIHYSYIHYLIHSIISFSFTPTHTHHTYDPPNSQVNRKTHTHIFHLYSCSCTTAIPNYKRINNTFAQLPPHVHQQNHVSAGTPNIKGNQFTRHKAFWNLPSNTFTHPCISRRTCCWEQSGICHCVHRIPALVQLMPSCPMDHHLVFQYLQKRVANTLDIAGMGWQTRTNHPIRLSMSSIRLQICPEQLLPSCASIPSITSFLSFSSLTILVWISEQQFKVPVDKLFSILITIFAWFCLPEDRLATKKRQPHSNHTPSHNPQRIDMSTPDYKFAFGNFNYICSTVSLTLCPLVGEADGIEPVCYSRNVRLADTLIFQPCKPLFCVLGFRWIPEL